MRTRRAVATLLRIEETDGYTVAQLSSGVAILGIDISSAMERHLWSRLKELFKHPRER